MLVIDSSVVAEVLLGTEHGLRAMPHIGDKQLVAPDHCGAEVLSVLRGLSLGGVITDKQAITAINELPELGIEFLPTIHFHVRAWELRHNISAYDALYVVLAESLDAQIISLDSRLAKASDRVLVP